MSGLEGLLRGRVLGGRYRIEEVIGRGGMGAVYRATDERLGRQVAVKVITAAGAVEPELRDRLRARFLREARSAAGLPHHPNVVPVYDYGTDDELGLDYIVMELLRGNDLATRLQRAGPPPLPAALRILHEAARGLAVGHRAGLIHRDVKPGNIFLAEAGHDELEVRMVDFGIAKLADDEDTANQLTQDGRIPHSPAYASPEQLRGLTQLTPASDVFSLGAVGFQLLTGERPFTEADRNRMSLGMPVPVPSLRSRNPAIPAAVEAVIQKALDFDAQNRYPDAIAMTAALGTALRELSDAPLAPYAPGAMLPPLPTGEEQTVFVEDEDDRTQLMGEVDEDDRTLLAPAPGAAAAAPPPFPPPNRSAPRVEPPRRSRTAVWVWTLALLALAAVGVWAWTESTRTTDLANQFPVVEDSLVVDSTLAEDTVAEQPAADDALALNARGSEAYRAGRLEQALALFDQALEILPDNPLLRQNRGIALFKLGRLEQAERDLRFAIGADPSLDAAYANLAQVELAQRDTSAAIGALERFVEVTGNARARASAQRQLEALRIEQAGGLLGEPVDTVEGPELPPDAAPVTPQPQQ